MKCAQDVIKADLEHICCNLSNEFSQLSGKKLLITGGAGFLGYYLIQAALYWNKSKNNKDSIKVTVYDNYIRGIPLWLEQLKHNQDLKLFKYDITSPLPVDIEQFDFIIHAASIASPIYYRKHPIKTMDANVNGLRILLEYCLHKNDNLKGLLFFSTSEIYGDPSPHDIPTPETYRGNVSCTGPRACYDESKRYGETLCVNFANQYGLPIKVARPFNNYGPGLKITDRRLLPDFARNILDNQDITLYSDGSPTRTFCYVADAVIGYYKVLLNGRSGQAYNIGTDKPEISITEFADKLRVLAKEIVNYEGNIINRTSSDKNYLVDNPNRRCPLIDKARNEIGYAPAISLDEGLKRSLIWYKDNQCAEES